MTTKHVIVLFLGMLTIAAAIAYHASAPGRFNTTITSSGGVYRTDSHTGNVEYLGHSSAIHQSGK